MGRPTIFKQKGRRRGDISCRPSYHVENRHTVGQIARPYNLCALCASVVNPCAAWLADARATML